MYSLLLISLLSMLPQEDNTVFFQIDESHAHVYYCKDVPGNALGKPWLTRAIRIPLPAIFSGPEFMELKIYVVRCYTS